MITENWSAHEVEGIYLKNFQIYIIPILFFSKLEVEIKKEFILNFQKYDFCIFDSFLILCTNTLKESIGNSHDYSFYFSVYNTRMYFEESYFMFIF